MQKTRHLLFVGIITVMAVVAVIPILWKISPHSRTIEVIIGTFDSSRAISEVFKAPNTGQVDFFLTVGMAKTMERGGDVEIRWSVREADGLEMLFDWTNRTTRVESTCRIWLTGPTNISALGSVIQPGRQYRLVAEVDSPDDIMPEAIGMAWRVPK